MKYLMILNINDIDKCITIYKVFKVDKDKSSPLADNFFVFIIFAANSNPVSLRTHLLTIEKAPLK